MYKVIMAPTEGEASEKAAISLAVRLAQKFEADLRLVRVDSPQLIVEPVTTAAAFAETERAITEARISRLRKLEALGTECRVLGEIRVMTALEEGPVGPTLRAYAEKFNVDLVVMTSHCRGGLSRMTLGSVTDYLVRHTDIPVLVVKQPVSLLSTVGDSVHRIVVPLDGSVFAEQILPHVIALARTLKATVSLLQVLTPLTYSQKQIMQPGLPWWDNEIAAANEYLEHAAVNLTEVDVETSKDVVLSENVAGGILDYCNRARADLVAVASSGVGGLDRLVFGSVADEIVRRGKTSVLMFHPSAAAVKSTPAGLSGRVHAAVA